MCMSVVSRLHTHTNTHTYIYAYTYRKSGKCMHMFTCTVLPMAEAIMWCGLPMFGAQDTSRTCQHMLCGCGLVRACVMCCVYVCIMYLHLCMCVYVCMHICMHVCMNIRIDKRFLRQLC
jgi:hypothetical protein